MMKHAAPHRVILSKVLIGIMGFTMVCLLGSCSLHPAARNNPARSYYLNIQTSRNGNWPPDTLFTTPTDSVLFSAVVPPRHSVFRRPDEIDLDYSIDFGDGAFTDDAVIKTSSIAHKHLYPRKGAYMARVWGEYKDSVYCADTVYVRVQDYIWPTKAKRINVTIKGIAFNVLHVIERPGKRDSTYLTVEKDYACTVAEDTNRVFRWDPFHGLSFLERLEKAPDGFYWVGNSGHASFLADGRALSDFDLNIPVADSIQRTWRDNYASVDIQQLPLKPGTNPTAAHAVYERTYSRAEFERRYSSYDKAAGYSYSIREGNQTHRARTIHHSPYSDVTVTVEFTE